jgi:ribonuclease HII
MSEKFLIGIDDAGRGPIIGPMVLAGILIKKENESILKEWGVTDSKKLTAEKRKEIAIKLREKFEFHYELTSVDEIDQRGKVGTNLNRIEAIKAAKIINYLTKNKEQEVEIIIDCPSPNTESWRNCVLQYIDKKNKIKLKTEHKADFNHICCSAASIIAKTTRDAEIDKLKQETGLNLGSGYCSDPITCECLNKNLDFLLKNGLVRKSWATFDNLVANKEQKKLF